MSDYHTSSMLKIWGTIAALAFLAVVALLSGCAGFAAQNAGTAQATGNNEVARSIEDLARLEGTYQIEATKNALGQEVYVISVPYESARMRFTLAGDFILFEILERGKATLIVREAGVDIVNIPGLVR